MKIDLIDLFVNCSPLWPRGSCSAVSCYSRMLPFTTIVNKHRCYRCTTLVREAGIPACDLVATRLAAMRELGALITPNTSTSPFAAGVAALSPAETIAAFAPKNVPKT